MANPSTLAKLLPKARGVAPVGVPPQVAIDATLAELLPNRVFVNPAGAVNVPSQITVAPVHVPPAVPATGPVEAPATAPVMVKSTDTAAFSARVMAVVQGTPAQLAAAENPKRRYLAIQNQSTSPVYIQFSSASLSDIGAVVNAETVWEFDRIVPKNAVYIYGGSTGTASLLVTIIEGI